MTRICEYPVCYTHVTAHTLPSRNPTLPHTVKTGVVAKEGLPKTNTLFQFLVKMHMVDAHDWQGH